MVNNTNESRVLNLIRAKIQNKTGKPPVGSVEMRLLDEDKARRAKRARMECPFFNDGLCGNLRIRCGEREQLGNPETEKQKNTPHRCNYSPDVSKEDINILVIDDEPLIIDLCYEYFSNMGIERNRIIQAETLEDGYRVLREMKDNSKMVHLVLCDIKLKDKSGYDIVSYITERNMNSRIMLMSAYTSVDDRPDNYLGDEEIIEGEKVVGAVLRKAFRYSELLSCVEKNLPGLIQG